MLLMRSSLSRATGSRRFGVRASIATAAIVASTLTGMTTSVAAAESEVPTVQEYVAWLKKQKTAEADQIAEQFTALSAGNQQKFLNYLADPEVVKALAGEQGDADTTIAPNAMSITTKLAGGDVVTTVGAEATPTTVGAEAAPMATAAKAVDWKCSYWINQKVLGIEVTRHTLAQWYRANSTKVTKVYVASATHKNLNPGVSVDNQPEDQWISAAGNALAYVTWNVDFIFKGSEIHLDKRQHLRCDETGFRYGSIKNP